MKLRTRLLLPLLLISVLMGTYLHSVWLPRTLAVDEAVHLKALGDHLDSVVEGLIPLLLGSQLDIIHENLNALKAKNASWISIRLEDADGNQLFPLRTKMSGQPGAPTGLYVHTLRRHIEYLGSALGTLIVQVDLAPALANTVEEGKELAYILVGMVAILVLTTALTAELAVRRPVHQLSKAARHLAQREFDAPLPKSGNDEVGALVESFASMRDDLRQYQSDLLHEIAERKEAEAALKRLNETLEQRVQEEIAANREKEHMLIQQSRLAAMGEMVHNIAHQWRQPLNALGLVISNIMDDYNFKTLTRESLERDAASARRLLEKMSSTIDDFRDFFRPDREESTFDVAEAVREAEFIVDASLKNNRIGVSVDLPAGLVAKGFPNRYAQAVLNLLANAKQAIVDNKVESGNIRVVLEKVGDEAVLTVDDNGGGIHEDVLPRLFDPYFTTKEQGSGIGLYMVKMIIERNMAGKVTAANIDHGARFTLSIPLDGAKL